MQFYILSDHDLPNALILICSLFESFATAPSDIKLTQISVLVNLIMFYLIPTALDLTLSEYYHILDSRRSLTVWDAALCTFACICCIESDRISLPECPEHIPVPIIAPEILDWGPIIALPCLLLKVVPKFETCVITMYSTSIKSKERNWIREVTREPGPCGFPVGNEKLELRVWIETDK